MFQLTLLSSPHENENSLDQKCYKRYIPVYRSDLTDV